MAANPLMFKVELLGVEKKDNLVYPLMNFRAKSRKPYNAGPANWLPAKNLHKTFRPRSILIFEILTVLNAFGQNDFGG